MVCATCVGHVFAIIPRLAQRRGLCCQKRGRFYDIVFHTRPQKFLYGYRNKKSPHQGLVLCADRLSDVLFEVPYMMIYAKLLCEARLLSACSIHM